MVDNAVAPVAGQGGARPGYVPALDGLRAVSILCVVVSHLGVAPWVPGAFGVTLFFFISGYLITGQLLKGLRAGGRVDFAGFYLRRGLRLLPAGLTYIVVSGLVFQALGGRITAGGWFAAAFYGANYYDIWTGYRSNLAGVRHPFNILWSLAIEEHFYALWPAVLLACAAGRRIGWRAVWLVLAVCGAVLLWRLWLLHACAGGGAPWYCGPVHANPAYQFNRIYMATDTRLDSIAWGALMALLEGRVALAGRYRAGFGVVLLAVSFALAGPLGRHGLRGTLQGLALLGLVPWLVRNGSWPNRWLCVPAALLLGRLSYSLYLWHWGALAVADAIAPANKLTWLAVAVPLSLALAGASYWGIERPMLRLRRRFGSHAV